MDRMRKLVKSKIQSVYMTGGYKEGLYDEGINEGRNMKVNVGNDRQTSNRGTVE